MADFTIALERADDEAFTTGTSSRTFNVLVATNFRLPLEGPSIKYGQRAVNTTGWVRQIVITFDHFGVASDALYGQDSGDRDELEDIIYSPHFRIIPTGTDLPRTNGTGDWWPDFLGTGYAVVREAYNPSSSPEAGADVVTLTLRAVDPNT